MVNGLKTMIQIQNDVSISQLKENSTLGCATLENLLNVAKSLLFCL